MDYIGGTNTYLLRLIYNLFSLEFKMTRYQFFEKITSNMDNSSLERYRKNSTNNHWITPNKKTLKKSEIYAERIDNTKLKINIAKTLKFDSNLWDETDAKIQEKTITKVIEEFLDKENNMLKNLNLPSYKELKKDLTKDEQKLLKELKKYKAKAFKRINHDNMNLSQEMLVAMIILAYEFGYYQHLVNYIFPQLKTSNQLKTKILFIYANALGSHQLKEYEEASLILNEINTKDNLLYIDIKTAMTSNILRHRLTENLDENELRAILYSQSQNYKILFEKDDTHHYYPAINYGYMIAITNQLYPTDKEFQKLNKYTIKELSKLSQKSIKEDKVKDNTIDNYYASMTELEFSLIRNISVLGKLGKYLEENKPNTNLVSITLRQIIFFRDILKSSVEEINFDMKRLDKVIDMIESYIELKL